MWMTGLWRQFGAAIDMLDNAMRDCPEDLWAADMWEDHSLPGFSAFWYVAYHALFWLARYLSGSEEQFAPPAPFGLEELEAAVLPPRVYSRAELLGYLQHCREKCRTKITSVSEEELARSCKVGNRTLSFGELLLYDMRHVQEHAAQLNMFLGQRAGSASDWVGVATDPS